MNFDPKKYLGTWYQIAHYPSYFEGSNSWNTTANYQQKHGKILVTNSTVVNGKTEVAYGTAIYLGDGKFNVVFPGQQQSTEANYIVQQVWKKNGEYSFAVVTNPDQSMLFVLSRNSNPTAKQVKKIFAYLDQHFQVSKIVMTPHYS